MTTTNMGLTYVNIGDIQYAWAITWNSNFSIMDEHDHSLGNGVLIALSSINITRDFSFPSYIFNLSSIIFNNNIADITTYKNNLYVLSGELYFTDSNFRTVKITSGGSINYSTITGGGFTGEYSSLGAQCYYSNSGDYFFYDDSENLQLIQGKIICNTYTDSNYSDDFIICTNSLTVNCSTSGLTWNFPTSGNSVKLSILDLNLNCAASADSYVTQTDGGTEIYDSLIYSSSSCSREFGYTFFANSASYSINDINYSTISEYTTFESYPVFYGKLFSLNSQYNINIPIGDDIGIGISYVSLSVQSVYLPKSTDPSNIRILCTQIVPAASISSASTIFQTSVSALYVPCTNYQTSYFFDCFSILGQH